MLILCWNTFISIYFLRQQQSEYAHTGNIFLGQYSSSVTFSCKTELHCWYFEKQLASNSVERTVLKENEVWIIVTAFSFLFSHHVPFKKLRVDSHEFFTVFSQSNEKVVGNLSIFSTNVCFQCNNFMFFCTASPCFLDKDAVYMLLLVRSCADGEWPLTPLAYIGDHLGNLWQGAPDNLFLAANRKCAKLFPMRFHCFCCNIQEE